jgi:hypothetical protein
MTISQVLRAASLDGEPLGQHFSCDSSEVDVLSEHLRSFCGQENRDWRVPLVSAQHPACGDTLT